MKKKSLPGILAGLTPLLIAAVSTIATAHAAESPRLREDVTQILMMMDGVRDRSCTERKVVNAEVLEARRDGTSAVERWMLDRCGKAVRYRVRYTASPKGGDDFEVQLEK
jgi:hypothetical protein